METMALSFVHGTSMDVLCLRPLAVVMQESFAGFVEFIDQPSRHWLFYYVTAADVARAFRAALEIRGLRHGTFFLSAPDTCRPEPTLEWYRQRIAALPDIDNPRLFRLRPRASIFSSARARDLLGWEASSNFRALRAEWLSGATENKA
jgi:nucleoside-diphosphate-sugar epimerase